MPLCAAASAVEPGCAVAHAAGMGVAGAAAAACAFTADETIDDQASLPSLRSLAERPCCKAELIRMIACASLRFADIIQAMAPICPSSKWWLTLVPNCFPTHPMTRQLACKNTLRATARISI